MNKKNAIIRLINRVLYGGIHMKKINVNQKKIKISVVFALMFLIASSIIYILANQNVSMNITQVTDMDVLLIKSKTNTDLTAFNDDFLQKLEEKDISSEHVNIQTIETQIRENVPSFAWEKNVNTSVGSVTDTNNGKNIVMTGCQWSSGREKCHMDNTI